MDVQKFPEDFTVDEANDLANILKAGRLPAPAKIVRNNRLDLLWVLMPSHGGFMAFIFSFIVIFL